MLKTDFYQVSDQTLTEVALRSINPGIPPAEIRRYDNLLVGRAHNSHFQGLVFVYEQGEHKYIPALIKGVSREMSKIFITKTYLEGRVYELLQKSQKRLTPKLFDHLHDNDWLILEYIDHFNPEDDNPFANFGKSSLKGYIDKMRQQGDVGEVMLRMLTKAVSKTLAEFHYYSTRCFYDQAREITTEEGKTIYLPPLDPDGEKEWSIPRSTPDYHEQKTKEYIATFFSLFYTGSELEQKTADAFQMISEEADKLRNGKKDSMLLSFFIGPDVLIHGDVYDKNIIGKDLPQINDEGKPFNLYLIDLKKVRFSSPIIDLLFPIEIDALDCHKVTDEYLEHLYNFFRLDHNSSDRRTFVKPVFRFGPGEFEQDVDPSDHVWERMRQQMFENSVVISPLTVLRVYNTAVGDLNRYQQVLNDDLTSQEDKQEIEQIVENIKNKIKNTLPGSLEKAIERANALESENDMVKSTKRFIRSFIEPVLEKKLLI